MVLESEENIANYPALWKTVYEKNEKEMKTLLQGSTSTEVVGGVALQKTTPLQLAVRMNQYSMVKLLLQKGANVHVRTYFGETLLHDAVVTLGRWEAFKMVRILLQNGAVVDSVDYKGWTALHMASNRDKHDVNMYGVMRLLLNHDADATLKTFGQQTAFEMASTTSSKDMLQKAEVETERVRVEAEKAHVNDSCFAFAMGQHKRLGQGTFINDLHPKLLRLVLQYRGV